MTAQWHFNRHIPGYEISNPVVGEHFVEGVDEEWKAGESLVRECIQNSLDARQEGQTVHVAFHVHGVGSMDAKTAAFWFGSLWPHLRAEDCQIRGLPSSPGPGGFVVVEDFGTLGLQGDVRQLGKTDDKNRFFNFFRANGLSGNSHGSNAGGSWGVGKSVFNRCSRINSFLALTVRADTRDLALMGKSLLRHHRLPDGEFTAFGWFGGRDAGEKHAVMPADDEEVVRRLRHDFHVRRPVGFCGTGEPAPGLSVVIPYADERVKGPTIKEIVAREYFYPILTGQLQVSITWNEPARGIATIDSESILDHVEGGKPGLAATIRLAQWALHEAPEQRVSLAPGRKRDKPAWGDDPLSGCATDVKSLVDRFAKGERIAFRVPAWVHKIGESPAESHFDVFLQRDPDGKGYRPIFVRDLIVVPGVKQRALRNRQVFALVVANDEGLANLLRAAEPPAHTHWTVDTANFRNAFQFGEEIIDFVLDAPARLTDAVSSKDVEPDFDVWADLFPVPDDAGRRPNGKRGRRPGEKTPAMPEPPKPRPKPFRIEQIEGGFVVSRDNPTETPRPERLRIEAAYDTSDGNPLKRYERFDFRFEDLQRSVAHAEVVRIDDNALLIEPMGDGFRVVITGFDPNRDLYVKVDDKVKA